MPLAIPTKAIETPDRRQITGVNFNVALDTNTTPAAVPTLTATVTFTDLWRTPDGLPVSYPVAGSVIITHDELMAIPGALQTLGALQVLAYSKAAEQGL